MASRVLIDQWHIDFYATKKLTKKEREEITAVFESPWFPDMLHSVFDPQLRKKLKIKVTK